MKAVFYVFSGTGNTRRVCLAAAEAFRAAGAECEFAEIEEGKSYPNPNGFDRIVIGYPVHAFNAPRPVFRFLKNLPRRTGEGKVYFIKTSGEPLKLNDGSCARVSDLCRKRGYSVCGEFHYVMPYNIIFRHSDGMAARMWQAVQRRLPADTSAIWEGRRIALKKGPFKRAVSFLFRIEHAGMPLIGRGFKADERCIGCGLCAEKCPQKNIEMKDGLPVFGKSCTGCLRCSFHCPKDAIRTGILNGWKVNGSYSFGGEPASDEEVCRFCRRSYLRYFAEAEKYPLPERAAATAATAVFAERENEFFPEDAAPAESGGK